MLPAILLHPDDTGCYPPYYFTLTQDVTRHTTPPSQSTNSAVLHKPERGEEGTRKRGGLWQRQRGLVIARQAQQLPELLHRHNAHTDV
ncbi:hypothetical protein ACOMHN_014045 [Nucella lapillus]